MSASNSMQVPLQLLRARSGESAPVLAWLIPSHDPLEWFAYCSALEPRLDQWRILPVPEKVGSTLAGGALLFVDGETPKAAVRSRAIPYTCRAGKLYFPAEAVLDPQLTDAELSELFPLPVYIFHPGMGLLGFEKNEVQGLEKSASRPACPGRLIGMPHARKAALPRPNIEIVLDAPPPSVNQILQEGKGDIGSQAKPPQKPGEAATGKPGNGTGVISKAGQAVQNGLSKTGMWLAEKLSPQNPAGKPGAQPTPDDSNSWLKSIAQWPAEKLAAWMRKLQEQREKELYRLMRMMEQDPDEGLKHALPLTGAGQRGIAPPGANLGTRDPNFNLGRIKGSGTAADGWALPWEVQNKLREQYRQAANRELALGRYRRAAYIFAELLGDLHSAALALKQGKHFREAAALYKDMLNMPLQAAQCLADGGLLLEAVALYEENQAWVSAGDLYIRLERTEDAERVYRKAADRMIEQNDRLGAAEILLGKVKATDGALAILWSSWPSHHQAQKCIERAYAVLNTEYRHGEAAQRLEWLPQTPYAPSQAGGLVRFLCEMKQKYPTREVRERAGDIALCLAGKRLAVVDAGDAAEFLTAIRSLHPEDRLLSRDALRYQEVLRKKPAPPPPVVPTPVKPQKKKMAVKIGEASFSDNALFRFYQYESNGDALYAVSKDHQNTWRVYRRAWKAKSFQQLNLKSMPAHGMPNLLPSRRLTNPIWLGGLQAEGLKFAGSEEGLEPQSVRSIFASPERQLGAGLDEQDNLFALYLDQANGLALMTCSNNGTIRGTFELGDLLAAHPQRHIPMIARRERLYFSLGGMVYLFESEKKQATPVFDISGRGPIRGLCTTASYTALVMAATQQEGGAVLWPEDHRSGTILRFGDGLFNPHACFTRSGYLIAVAATHPHAPGEGRIYHLGRNELRLVSSFSFPAAEITAVIPGEGLDEFAVCTQYGTVHVFQIQ